MTNPQAWPRRFRHAYNAAMVYTDEAMGKLEWVMEELDKPAGIRWSKVLVRVNKASNAIMYLKQEMLSAVEGVPQEGREGFNKEWLETLLALVEMDAPREGIAKVIRTELKRM